LRDTGIGSMVVNKRNPREIWCGIGLSFVGSRQIPMASLYKGEELRLLSSEM